MTLVGRTALSDETRMKRSTPASRAASAMTLVPMTLLAGPTITLRSTSGRCL